MGQTTAEEVDFTDPLRIDQVAALFRVHIRTPEKWAKDGLLASTGKGQARLFSRAQVDALLRGE